MSALDASAIMTIKPKPVEAGHEQHRRAGKTFILTGHENSQITLITPDLKSITIATDNNEIRYKPTGMDNYHALVATRHHNDVIETAIRYVYSFGKPSGYSPKQLTEFSKSSLEIVPDPIPREHWHYKGGSEAAFIIRYNNKPLAATEVSLSTSNASIVKAVTDAKGRAVFALPDDFTPSKPGRGNEFAELLVHVKHQHQNQQYATWLSADYEANPAQWRSTGTGTMVATGGFVFGALITGLGFRNKKTSRTKK
ncbi:MAG: hypothetical protein EP315_06920 [Gammaproteobacteria bacterium]|nr:MAG: hypothetical protein EP315_06920 [Gammaproteobacteria bacterium]